MSFKLSYICRKYFINYPINELYRDIDILSKKTKKLENDVKPLREYSIYFLESPDMVIG